MKITSLEPQQKNKNRLNMYIEGAFHCGMNVATAASLGLYKGKEVTSSEISNIDSEDEYQKCISSALNLASRRMQSECEYWQKLGKKYDKAVIGRCLDRLRTLGYANDKAFAETWVRERSNTRGKRLLEQELYIKGINKGCIEGCLENIDSDDMYLSALVLGEKKYKENLPLKENDNRITNYLLRKGYSYNVIKQVLGKINKTTD